MPGKGESQRSKYMRRLSALLLLTATPQPWRNQKLQCKLRRESESEGIMSKQTLRSRLSFPNFGTPGQGSSLGFEKWEKFRIGSEIKVLSYSLLGLLTLEVILVKRRLILSSWLNYRRGQGKEIEQCMFSKWSQWGKFSSFLCITIEFNTTPTHGIKKKNVCQSKILSALPSTNRRFWAVACVKVPHHVQLFAIR